MLKGFATVVSLGAGGIYLRQQAAEKRRKKQALEAEDAHKSFTCRLYEPDITVIVREASVECVSR